MQLKQFTRPLSFYFFNQPRGPDPDLLRGHHVQELHDLSQAIRVSQVKVPNQALQRRGLGVHGLAVGVRPEPLRHRGGVAGREYGSDSVSGWLSYAVEKGRRSSKISPIPAPPHDVELILIQFALSRQPI